MNNDMNRPELDDILFEFVGSTDLPNWTTVQQWMARYPQYAKEISDFAAAWILSETMPEHPETAAIPEERWREIGRQAFMRAVAEPRAAYGEQQSLTSLIDAAQQQGIGPAALVRRVGLSRALLIGIDRRLITGVPAAVIDRIAGALNTTSEAVSAYLRQPATFAAGAQFKADRSPTMDGTMSFADAVRADEKLSQAEKDELLKLAQQDDDRNR